MTQNTKHKRTRNQVREDNAIRLKAKKAKQNTYFTGRPCRNNHIAERYVKNDLCVECVQANNARKIEKAKIQKHEADGMTHYRAVEFVKREALCQTLWPLVMHHLSMDEVETIQAWADKKTALNAK